VRELPALVEDHGKAEIADAQFLADDTHRKDVGAGSTIALWDSKGSQAERIGLPDPAPRDARFRRR